MLDKYSATWVSHSSINNFLVCPRTYDLANVYKNPDTGHKISIITPPLALGQTVHSVIEALSVIPTDLRFDEPLMTKFNQEWKKIAGQNGGFTSTHQEEIFKKRGQEMIRKVLNKPGPLKNLAIKINQDLPNYWLSEDDNIILCGKIDWLEYLEDEDKVHIIDFKTSKKEEQGESLQLPIYHLLVTNTQKRPVAKMSYWYLEFADKPKETKLPNLKESVKKVLKIAKEIKLARSLERYNCPNGKKGCRACRPYESVLRGEALQVGINDFGQDVFVVSENVTQNANSRVL